MSELVKKLRSLNKGIKTMTPFWRNFSDLELMDTRLRFNDGESPEGVKWRNPISLRRDAGGSEFSQSQAWWYWKKSNFHAVPKGWHFFIAGQDKVLRDTGNLFNSIQNRYSKNSMEVGTDLKYGRHVQNKGFEFIGRTNKTDDNAKEAFTAYIQRLIK